MEVEEYLKFYGISKQRFGEFCGVTRMTINNISSKRKLTSIPLALRIEEVTNGEVKAINLVADSCLDRLKLVEAYNKKVQA